jgi:hypothetical protein
MGGGGTSSTKNDELRDLLSGSKIYIPLTRKAFW